MTTTTGHFVTPKASQYLQQLCKHFAHKTEASFSETEGTVVLSRGTLMLKAADGRLEASFDAPDPETDAAMRNVVDRHLARFAFREDFQQMDWQVPPVSSRVS